VCGGPIFSITRDEIKSQDENSLKEMNERIKLVFSPKLVLTGVSSPVLDLPYMCLYLYNFSYCSSKSRVVRIKSCKSCGLIPRVSLNNTQFHSLHSYTQIGDETGTGRSN
jgi:hypothetical protein